MDQARFDSEWPTGNRQHCHRASGTQRSFQTHQFRPTQQTRAMHKTRSSLLQRKFTSTQSQFHIHENKSHIMSILIITVPDRFFQICVLHLHASFATSVSHNFTGQQRHSAGTSKTFGRINRILWNR